jgi:hypothetical protein
VAESLAQEINEAQLASLTCLTDSEVATVTEEVEAVKRQSEQERARHQQVHCSVTVESSRADES